MTWSSAEESYRRAPDPAVQLGISIANTLCCCTVVGIVGIVYSALAMSLRNAGNWPEEARCATLARRWNLIGIAIAGVLIVVGVLADDPSYSAPP